MNNGCQGRDGETLAASKAHHNKHSGGGGGGGSPNHPKLSVVPPALCLYLCVKAERIVSPLPCILKFCDVEGEINHKFSFYELWRYWRPGKVIERRNLYPESLLTILLRIVYLRCLCAEIYTKHNFYEARHNCWPEKK